MASLKRPTGSRQHCVALVALLCCVSWTVNGGSITIVFGPAAGITPDYDRVSVYMLPAKACGGWEESVKWSTTEKSFQKTYPNLEPGEYYFALFSGTWENKTLARPGAYYSGVFSITLTNRTAAETEKLEYRPLTNLLAWKGSGELSGQVLDYTGKPMPDLPLRLCTGFPEQKGRVFDLESALTRSDGSFVFRGVNTNRGFGVSLRDDLLGRLSFGQTNVFRLQPRAGDPVPDMTFYWLPGRISQRLSDLRSKVVVLEFWATWCGPCQSAMERFQEYESRRGQWGDRVQLIGLSLDDSKDKAVAHLQAKGWTKTRQAWAGAGGWESAVSKALHLGGIPTILVVDPQGRIAALCDPREVKLVDLVDRLLTDIGPAQVRKP